MLLIHGNPGSARGFAPLKERLEAEGLRVLAYTLPGFDGAPPPANGRYDLESQADFLWQKLASDGVQDVVLMGHSHGGSVAVVMAGQRPEQVQGLCLCASAGLATGNYLWLGNALGKAAAPLLGKVVDELELEVWLARLMADYATGPKASPVPNDQLLPFTGDTLVATVRTAEAWDGGVLKRHARAIRCPVLVLHGTKDRNVPPWQIRGLVRVIPGARVVWLKGVGHRPHQEAPATVVEALVSQSRR